MLRSDCFFSVSAYVKSSLHFIVLDRMVLYSQDHRFDWNGVVVSCLFSPTDSDQFRHVVARDGNLSTSGA